MSRERALLKRMLDLSFPCKCGMCVYCEARALLAEPEERSPHPEEMGQLFVGRTRMDEVQSRLRKPTPRSRAEAEAMVEAYHSARDRMQIAAIECNVAEYHQGAFDMANARAALLAALTGDAAHKGEG